MSNKINSIKGFPDILPDDSKLIRYIEDLLLKITDRYGLKEIRTPILEKSELFNRSIGDSTDIVTKEMYSFEDRNGDNICLRPEGTAGILRSVLQHNLIFDRGIKKQKLWYYGSMFRHENPQRGRFRQFTQFGIEYFGYNDTNTELELIQIVEKFFRCIGFKDYKLHINSLGDENDRNKYREIVKDHFSNNLHLLDESQLSTYNKNPLRLLDSKDDSIIKLCESLPNLYEIINNSSKDNFNNLLEKMKISNIKYVVDNTIVRGLDYYNDFVFEWKTDKLGSQNAICAGGRYDLLVSKLSDNEVPAIGLAMGIERVLELIIDSQKIEQVKPIPIVDQDGSDSINFMKITAEIRDKIIDQSFFNTDSSASFKSQLKYSRKINNSIAIIVDSTKDSNNIKIYLHKTNEIIETSLDAVGKKLSEIYE